MLLIGDAVIDEHTGFGVVENAKWLQVDPRRYRHHLGVDHGEPLPVSNSSGIDHPAGVGWLLAGLGWRRRKVPDGAEVHRSVERRIEHANLSYRAHLPRPRYVDK